MIKNTIQTLRSNVLKFIRTIWANIRYLQYKIYCKFVRQKQYILFNAPIHGNLGDHAIAMAAEQLLKEFEIKVFEVPTRIKDCYMHMLKKSVKPTAILFICGGGFMGSQWTTEESLIREVIETFNNNKIIVFPQTIYYSNDNYGKEEYEKSLQIYNKHKDLTLFTRERKSYELAKTAYTNCKVILAPDIVIHLKPRDNSFKRDGILLCIRKDPESKLTEDDKTKIEDIVYKYTNNIKKTDTVLSKRVHQDTRKIYLNKKMNEFNKSKLVITDRLHGMIFALITRTPCIAIGNYNHKIKGVYDWIKNVDYIEFVDQIDDIEQLVKTLYNKQDNNYDYEKISEEFNILKQLIKETKK